MPIECGTMLLLTTGRDSLTDAIDSQINTLTYRDQKSGLDRGTLVDEALRRLLVPRSSPFTIELALAADRTAPAPGEMSAIVFSGPTSQDDPLRRRRAHQRLDVSSTREMILTSQLFNPKRAIPWPFRYSAGQSGLRNDTLPGRTGDRSLTIPFEVAAGSELGGSMSGLGAGSPSPCPRRRSGFQPSWRRPVPPPAR